MFRLFKLFSTSNLFNSLTQGENPKNVRSFTGCRLNINLFLLQLVTYIEFKLNLKIKYLVYKCIKCYKYFKPLIDINSP